MTWALVPVSELKKLPLFGYKLIDTENDVIIYEHHSKDWVVIVDSTEEFARVYFEDYDEYLQF